MSIILAAIPMFLILILIELLWDRKKGKGFYRFNDAINSLNLGILSRLIGLLTALIPMSLYVYCYQHFALLELSEQSIGVWIVAFVLYDLAYYWSHRLNHRIAVMWGSHVVHHSSEEYNLTTALRQTSTPSLLGWAMFIPLAFIGVPPLVALACGSLNLVYQFWVHTRHINKMPSWYEAIFVTPSHHRVHHALNREYIDKNYAGVFILWDKIFGSFQPELDDVDIVYGVSHQLKSWNPIWANVKVYWHLSVDAFRTKDWLDKFKVFFKPPGWRPEDVTKSHPMSWVTTKTMVKYDVTLPLQTKIYLLAQYLVFIVLIFAFLLQAAVLSIPELTFICLFCIASLVVISGIQEMKTWTYWIEPIRLAGNGILVIKFGEMIQLQGAAVLAFVYVMSSLTAFYFVCRQKVEKSSVL